MRGFPTASGVLMPTTPDLLYVALFAVWLPLLDYLFFWPAFRLRLQVDPAGARTALYAVGIAGPWGLVAGGAALWLSYDRSWASFGFSVPDGWRLWVAAGLTLLLVAYTVYAVVALLHDAEARESVRQRHAKLGDFVPHTRTELYRFAGASVTAGFCEEFLFRGYFIWALAPWLGWWGAAALSIAIFASAHAYQGLNGALQTGVVATLLTLVVATLGSLWPAIVLHALIDLSSGIIAWLALREAPNTADPVDVQSQTEPRSPSGVKSNTVQSEPAGVPDRRLE
jgi:membrane protease YdiL (CAAX protease family)